MRAIGLKRWNAPLSAGGLIAVSAGASWAAMAILAAAAGACVVIEITGLLGTGLLALLASRPGLPPNGAATWRAQALIGALTAAALAGIPAIPAPWRGSAAVLSVIVPALAARCLGALLAWRIGIPLVELAPPSWRGSAATCVIAVALMLGTFPAPGPGAIALGWAAGVAYGAAIDRWHLPTRCEDIPLIAQGIISLVLIAAGTHLRAIAEIVTDWPLTALRLAGAALAVLLLGRVWRASRLERLVGRWHSTTTGVNARRPAAGNRPGDRRDDLSLVSASRPPIYEPELSGAACASALRVCAMARCQAASACSGVKPPSRMPSMTRSRSSAVWRIM